jgi:hypothetical protein
MESKDYSWEYVRTSRAVHTGPCELVFAELDPKAAGADATLYNGTNTTGKKIVGIQASAKTNRHFKPKVPIYCNKGLYVSIGSNVTGVLVQWRGQY